MTAAVWRLGVLALGLWAAAPLQAAQERRGTVSSREPIRVYVATNGNDEWSGRLRAPNRARTDGPFATLQRAQRAVRELRASAGERPIEVLVRRGTYTLKEPLAFTPEDSGTPSAPVTYAAYAGERPVISGGQAITGWKVTPEGRWEVTLPEVARGEWAFTQLFVNGQRRYRPRLPKEGYYFIADAMQPTPRAQGRGYDRFRFRRDDVRASWHNLEDVEVLAFQVWTMARLRVAGVDEADRDVSFTGRTRSMDAYSSLPKGNRYIVENVREALERPGEWYLDRRSGVLTYIPMRGEDPKRTVVVAPRLDDLLQLKGDVAGRKWVQHLVFRGLVFAHTNWVTPPEGNTYPQAEVNLGATVSARGARDCSWTECAVVHTGNYALELGEGCRNNRVERCELADLAAGGVKLGTQGIPPDEEAVASHNTVRDCLIAHGGRMHPAAVGVWIGHSPYNTIEHNDIQDFYYTGVSVGWSWGYGRSLANHNTIAHNRISQIGQGVLSDMGGIYLLGLAPGTVLHHNRIEDVNAFSYGGWGIYPDEGSTDLLIESNVTFRTKSAGFHQHYGRTNTVRNNIFAFGREAQVMRTRAEEHLSFTFERNIVYWTEGPLLGSNWSGNNYKLDHNLYWNAAAKPVTFAGMTLEQWREKGQDVHSLIADPLFVAPEKGDFRLKPGSPAEKVGFKPFDLQDVGRLTKRTPLVTRVPRAFPPPPPPQPIVEDFEDTPVGQKAPGAETSEENDQATIRVTEETAASGKRSLKFVDAPGQQHDYNPHLYYNPGLNAGVVAARFSLRVEPGARLYHEWRTGGSPYDVGPSLVVGPDGTLSANGKELMKLPLSQWVRFSITCPLGDKAKGAYALTVQPVGGALRRFPSLSCSPAFTSLQWFGFSATGRAAAVFYLDDVEIRTRG